MSWCTRKDTESVRPTLAWSVAEGLPGGESVGWYRQGGGCSRGLLPGAASGYLLEKCGGSDQQNTCWASLPPPGCGGIWRQHWAVMWSGQRHRWPGCPQFQTWYTHRPTAQPTYSPSLTEGQAGAPRQQCLPIPQPGGSPAGIPAFWAPLRDIGCWWECPEELIHEETLITQITAGLSIILRRLHLKWQPAWDLCQNNWSGSLAKKWVEREMR